MKPVFFSLLAWSLLLSAAMAGKPGPSSAAAARDYGTPACPANARGIFQTGVFPARGLVRNFDEQTNIRWKTPLPNFGMNTPVIAAGLETRQYQAQYLDGDELVGPLSDVLVVTVPER